MPRLLALLLLLVLAVPLRAQPARPLTDEVFYELFVRDFTPDGTLRAAQAKLPEVRALGVTTIWLMPIFPIGEVQRKGTYGSPYSVRDYTAVSPDLGTVDDLRAFAEAAHSLGMRVVLDWVANHTAWDHAWMQQHPDWYTRDSTGRVVPPVADWADVADLNYDAPGLRRAMTDALRFWLTQGVDGFRCDVAEMVPIGFWRDALAELRAVKPVLMLAEGATPDLYDAGFDLTYDWTLYGAMKEVWKQGKPATTLTAPLALVPGRLKLRFTTNHDETAWDRPPVFAFNGSRGALAAFATVALLPGVPLVYNGQEGGSIEQTGLFEKQPLPAPDPEVRAHYEDLLALRTRHDVLRRGALVVHDTGPDVLAFERVLPAEAGQAEQRVLAVVNLRPGITDVRLPAALLDRYNGTRTVAPVRTESVLDLAALQADTGDRVRVGSLAVPALLSLGGYEVRTWGTVVLRTR